MMKKSLLGGLALATLVATSGQALADSFDYTINLANAGLPYAGPYATVDVNRTSSTVAVITFTSLTTGGITFLMGADGAAAVNVNAGSWSVSSLTGTVLAGFTTAPTDLSAGAAGNEDGFGSFNTKINNFDGYTHSHDSISFTLTNLSGTWVDASSVLTGNASGYSVAIHGFACTATCTTGAGALNTGFAVNGSVPEPASLLLLGAGLAGLGIWRRKSA